MDFNQYLNKLENLTTYHKPLWGKMSAQHMVEHLILAVKMGNGKLRLECFNPQAKLPALRRFLLSKKALPKEFINPVFGTDLLPLEFSGIEEAKEKLKSEIKDYIKYFKDNPDAKPTNVTFGELNKEEWDIFHQKHFTHHLKQFGLF
jgi:Protein of unknown function (DUF1569)